MKELRNAVKKAPFINAFLYILMLSTYFFELSETTELMVDNIFFTSISQVFIWLYMSKRAGFCRWHKLACSIPLIGSIGALSLMGAADKGLEYTNLILLIFISVLTIVCGIKVLWKK